QIHVSAACRDRGWLESGAAQRDERSGAEPFESLFQAPAALRPGHDKARLGHRFAACHLNWHALSVGFYAECAVAYPPRPRLVPCRRMVDAVRRAITVDHADQHRELRDLGNGLTRSDD